MYKTTKSSASVQIEFNESFKRLYSNFIRRILLRELYAWYKNAIRRRQTYDYIHTYEYKFVWRCTRFFFIKKMSHRGRSVLLYDICR